MERLMEAVAAKSPAANYDVICMLRSRMGQNTWLSCTALATAA
jgi:hypothetical protein